MKKISKLVITAMIALTLGIFGINQGSVSAMSLEEGAEAARCDSCPAELFGDTGVFRQVTNTILYFVGIIAVIMLIWGGIRYVVSGGDAKKVTDAKNTILYAIIGLVISFLAYAIVQFVINALPAKQQQQQQQPAEAQQTSSLVVEVEA
jgi:glucose uptake protein GlcU